MSEPAIVVSPKPPAADVNGQLIVALATVAILGVLGGWLIEAGLKTEGAAILGSIVGALATSLNSPTGIGNVIRNATTAPVASATPTVTATPPTITALATPLSPDATT